MPFLMKAHLFTCASSSRMLKHLLDWSCAHTTATAAQCSESNLTFQQCNQCKWSSVSHLLLCLVSGYVKSVKVHLITATWTKQRMTTKAKQNSRRTRVVLDSERFTRAAATRSVWINCPKENRATVLSQPRPGPKSASHRAERAT